MLVVSDDSGFVALVVPATYRTFVSRDWTFDELAGHFRREMARYALLIWATGLEGMWRVRLNREMTDTNGFREVTGQLTLRAIQSFSRTTKA